MNPSLRFPAVQKELRNALSETAGACACLCTGPAGFVNLTRYAAGKAVRTASVVMSAGGQS